MMCCGFQYKLEVTFASEAELQLFLACSVFLGKFEPPCSYKIVLIIKSVCMLFCFLILYFFIPLILMQLFS